MCFTDNTDKAAGKAKKEYKKAFEEIRGWLGPYVSGGQQGFEELLRRAMAGPGEFEASPGYAWAKKEALDSLNSRAYASGSGGGALEKARMKYSEGLASQEYQNWLNNHYASLNPFIQISQIGLNAANNLSGFRRDTAKGVADMLLTQGQAKDRGLMNIWNMGMDLMDNVGKVAGMAGGTRIGDTAAASAGGGISGFSQVSPQGMTTISSGSGTFNPGAFFRD